MRLPFTKVERRRRSRQDGYGYRACTDWGRGILPAPWAEGDIVELVGERPNRMRDLDDGPHYVVCSGFSIDEGDAWYFRLADREGHTSDRLHVVYKERSTWDRDVDWMAAFRLVDTSDPDGLTLREKLLTDGWQLTKVCDRCGQPLRGSS